MNKFNFIINDFKEATEVENRNAVFSFLIDVPEDIDRLDFAQLHQKGAFENEKVGLSVYFNFHAGPDADQQFVEDILLAKNSLLQLFFHPRYEVVANKPVLFFNQHSEGGKNISLLITSLDDYCVAQGFHGLEIIYLSEEAGTVSQILHRYLGLATLKALYENLLVESFYVAQYFSVVNSSKNDTAIILLAQLDIETGFKNRYPQKHAFLQQFAVYKYKTKRLENDLRYSQAELTNQKAYLEIFREQDEALKINEFYQNEYEVLPLWYKQFGHLIKVLTGKRTWRSLFNNNVKKYKN